MPVKEVNEDLLKYIEAVTAEEAPPYTLMPLLHASSEAESGDTPVSHLCSLTQELERTYLDQWNKYFGMFHLLRYPMLLSPVGLSPSEDPPPYLSMPYDYFSFAFRAGIAKAKVSCPLDPAKTVLVSHREELIEGISAYLDGIASIEQNAMCLEGHAFKVSDLLSAFQKVNPTFNIEYVHKNAQNSVERMIRTQLNCAPSEPSDPIFPFQSKFPKDVKPGSFVEEIYD